MMIQKNKQQEQGRSMVEMLGVLAVVGVLSVGGIAGYTYAMNKYYTNELLAGASERAVLVSAQILVGKTPSLNEFNNTIAGGTFGTVEEFDDGGFGLKVSDVKDVVCQNVIKATADTSIFIAKDDNAEVLNEMSESDCSGDNNAFWFVYDDLGGNGANSGGDSTEGGTEQLNCVNGIWDDKYNKCACATGWTGELCDKKEIKTCTDFPDICNECQTCVEGACVSVDNELRKNCSIGEDGLCIDGQCIDCAQGISSRKEDYSGYSCSIEGCWNVFQPDVPSIHSCISNQEKADEWCYIYGPYNEGVKYCENTLCRCDN